MSDLLRASASVRPEPTSDAQIAALVKHLRVMGFIMPAVMKAAVLIEELHARASKAEDLCDDMDKAQSAMFDSLESAVAKMREAQTFAEREKSHALAVLEGARLSVAATEAEQKLMQDVLARLFEAAKLLAANAEGCIISHYSDDYAIHGLPGWLTDCLTDIEAAREFLAAAPKGSGRSLADATNNPSGDTP